MRSLLGHLTLQNGLKSSIFLATLSLGVYALIRNSRAGRSKAFNPVMALQVAYLLHAELCLMLSWREWEVGAYSVLVTAASFLLQIILVSMPIVLGCPRGLYPATNLPESVSVERSHDSASGL